MMAAQGLDVLFFLWVFSSGFIKVAVLGSENGTSEVFVKYVC